MCAVRRRKQEEDASLEAKRKRDISFCDFVLDQLSDLPDLLCHGMFGGFGLYSGESFFGLIAAGRLYLLTDEQTRKNFIERGMGPFRPSERQTLSSYYEVPLEVLEDAEELTRWAREALKVRAELVRAASQKRKKG